MSANRITMLGTTRSGKTCYMLAMYARMQLGIGAFTLAAKDLDEDIDLTDLYETLRAGNTEGRWPRASTNTKTYDFEFCHALKPMTDFEWIDYRGKLLSQTKDIEDKAEIKTLLNYLKTSTCVFICVSGEHLQEKVTDANIDEIAGGIRARRINQFLTQLSKEIELSEENPFPIVIMITKFDLCSHRNKEVDADLQKLFAPLFAAKSGWLVALCPVTLGRELASDDAAGLIEPKNVHKPLVFALYSRFSKHAKDTEASLHSYSDQLSNLSRGWFKSWINSEMISTIEEHRADTQQEMDVIDRNMALLSTELRTVKCYLSGRLVSKNGDS